MLLIFQVIMDISFLRRPEGVSPLRHSEGASLLRHSEGAERGKNPVIFEAALQFVLDPDGRRCLALDDREVAVSRPG